MYILKAVSIFLWFAVLPVIIGMLFTRKMKEERNSLKMAVLCGYAAMFAVFELLALPMIFLKMPFSTLVWIFFGITVAAVVLSLILNRKRGKEMLKYQWSEWKTTPFSMYAAAALIAVQAACYLFFMLSDLDDAFYVATATTTLHTDTMFQFDAYTGDLLRQLPSRYVLSPFPVWIAFLSKVTTMHPAAMAHTVLPVFFVPLSYMVYGLIGRKLFEGKRRETGWFLCLLSAVNLFSYYSVYTQGTFLLIRIWQGKAVLAAILLPAVFYFCIRSMRDKEGKTFWILLFLTLTASCLVSSMGIMLSPIMAGIFAILYGIGNKDPKTVGKVVLCCIPSLICAGMYLLMR